MGLLPMMVPLPDLSFHAPVLYVCLHDHTNAVGDYKGIKLFSTNIY